MSTPSRRLGALLCVAVVGVGFAIGLFVADVAGSLAAALYAGVALLLIAVVARRARHLLAPPVPPRLSPSGHTCTCCTTSQHDPVQVLP